jgi:thiamine pyrophosphate-dependent acetolactate synthase large subunit-like protein
MPESAAGSYPSGGAARSYWIEKRDVLISAGMDQRTPARTLRDPGLGFPLRYHAPPLIDLTAGLSLNDVEPAELNRTVTSHVQLLGDAKLVVEDLLPLVGKLDSEGLHVPSWLDERGYRSASIHPRALDPQAGPGPRRDVRCCLRLQR